MNSPSRSASGWRTLLSLLAALLAAFGGAPLCFGTSAPTTTGAPVAVPNPAPVGQATTVTAQVSSSGGTVNTGSVTFRVRDRNSVLVQTVTGTVNATGAASAVINAPTVPLTTVLAPYAITAQFTGGGAFAASPTESSATAFSTTPDSTVTTLAAPSPSSAAVGQPVTLTAGVVSSTGTAVNGGTVTFTLTDRNGVPTTTTATVINNTATVDVNTALAPLSAAVSPYAVTAQYTTGAADFNASPGPSAPQPLAITPAGTTTTLQPPSPNPAEVGQPVNVTADVSSATGAPVDNGSVLFTVVDRNGSTVRSVSATVSGGVASTAIAGPTNVLLASGSPYSVTAQFQGTPEFQSSPVSAAQPLTIGQAPTSTALQSVIPNPAAVGQPVTLTAMVTASTGTVVTGGTVTFTLTDRTGHPQTLSSGVTDGTAAVTVNSPSNPLSGALSPYTVTAQYTAGAGEFQPSPSPSAPTTLTINPAGTTTALRLSSPAIVVGQPLTLTATVTSTTGPVVNGGTVTFFDSTSSNTPGSPIATAPVSGGQAAVTLDNPTNPLTGQPFTAGAHFLTARYTTGTTEFAPGAASPAQPLAVSPAGTTVAVQVTPNSVTLGAPVTLSATVTANAPSVAVVNEGTVSFFDGNTPIPGAQDLPVRNGQVSVSGIQTSTAVLPASTSPHTIRAQYSGTANFSPNQGSATLNVAPSSVTMTLSAAPSPSTYPQPVTFTATVTNPVAGGGAPAGTITFTDLFEGTTTALATVPLSTVSGGAGLPASSASLSLNILLPGTHQVTASFAPSPNFVANTASVSETVQSPQPSINSLSGSPAGLVPSQVLEGSAPFTLTINGAGFTSDSRVLLNGTAIPASRVHPQGFSPGTTSTSLAVDILSSDVAEEGTVTVQVVNPNEIQAGESLSSNTVSLTVADAPITAVNLTSPGLMPQAFRSRQFNGIVTNLFGPSNAVVQHYLQTALGPGGDATLQSAYAAFNSASPSALPAAAQTLALALETSPSLVNFYSMQRNLLLEEIYVPFVPSGSLQVQALSDVNPFTSPGESSVAAILSSSDFFSLEAGGQPLLFYQAAYEDLLGEPAPALSAAGDNALNSLASAAVRSQLALELEGRMSPDGVLVQGTLTSNQALFEARVATLLANRLGLPVVPSVGANSIDQTMAALVSSPGALAQTGGANAFVEAEPIGGANAGELLPLGAFTDANPGATADDYTSAPPGTAASLISWGDGMVDALTPANLGMPTRVASTPGQQGSTTWPLLGNHTYARAGRYSMTVVILDHGAGNSGATFVDVTPQAPADLQVRSIAGGYQLAWILAPTGADTIEIYRRVLGSTGDFGFLAAVPASQSAYFDATAAPGVLYEYEIRAVKYLNGPIPLALGSAPLPPSSPGEAGATALYSTFVTTAVSVPITPGAPGLLASPLSITRLAGYYGTVFPATSNLLTWSFSRSPQVPLGFRIFRQPVLTGPGETVVAARLLTTVNGMLRSFVDTTALPGDSYVYTIQALFPGGGSLSPLSNPAAVADAPGFSPGLLGQLAVSGPTGVFGGIGAGPMQELRIANMARRSAFNGPTGLQVFVAEPSDSRVSLNLVNPLTGAALPAQEVFDPSLGIGIGRLFLLPAGASANALFRFPAGSREPIATFVTLATSDPQRPSDYVPVADF